MTGTIAREASPPSRRTGGGFVMTALPDRSFSDPGGQKRTGDLLGRFAARLLLFLEASQSIFA